MGHKIVEAQMISGIGKCLGYVLLFIIIYEK